MAEIRREIKTDSGVEVSSEIRRGRTIPREISRIKQDGNTQIRTASQQGHKPSLGDRLNVVLRRVAPEVDNAVRSGVWGRETEREVPEDLHTADERRMLDTADDGTKIRETAFVGTAPYEIRDLGGRIAIRVTKPDSSVMVGVGVMLEDAVQDLERQLLANLPEGKVQS